MAYMEEYDGESRNEIDQFMDPSFGGGSNWTDEVGGDSEEFTGGGTGASDYNHFVGAEANKQATATVGNPRAAQRLSATNGGQWNATAKGSAKGGFVTVRRLKGVWKRMRSDPHTKPIVKAVNNAIKKQVVVSAANLTISSYGLAIPITGAMKMIVLVEDPVWTVLQLVTSPVAQAFSVENIVNVMLAMNVPLQAVLMPAVSAIEAVQSQKVGGGGKKQGKPITP